MSRRLAIILTGLLLLVGCIQTQIINFEATPRHPKPGDFFIEIMEKDQIQSPYKVIGIVRANAGKLVDPTTVLTEMREKARQMGGDALIDFGDQDARSGMIIPMGSTATYGSLRINYTAKVIVFQYPSAEEE